MMKMIISVVGVGAIAILAMSSTCSNEGNLGSATEIKASDTAESKYLGGGIAFKSISFAEAKKEALKSGKLIFVDAYTSWCGPCKRMAATSFKEKSVGDLFNKKFVNLKIEMEKDPDGPTIARSYGVKAYPTLLIINGRGKLVKKSVGMKNKDQLIAFANSAL